MDSLTHLAAGALTPLAFSRAPRLGAVVLFGIVAGELPDIDVVAGVSARAMLEIHRGPTHALPALLLFATLLALALNAWLKRAARRQAPGAPHSRAGAATAWPTRPTWPTWPIGQIWLAAFLALLLHVYLDSMTTFGTRVFLPLSDVRVALPALFIVDPLFTLPLVAVLVYCLLQLRRGRGQPVAPPAFAGQAGSARPGSSPNSASSPGLCGRDKIAIWARRALVWVVVYPLICLSLNALSARQLNQGQDIGGGGASRVHLTTTPLSPFLWKAVEESETEYRLATVSLVEALSGREPDFGPAYPRAVAAPGVHWQALRDALDIFRSYSAFASYPVVRGAVVEPGSGVLEITFEDLRYTPAGAGDLSRLYDSGGSMFLFQVRLDEKKQLLAWRYLSAFDKAEGAPWVELETPIPLD